MGHFGFSCSLFRSTISGLEVALQQVANACFYVCVRVCMCVNVCVSERAMMQSYGKQDPFALSSTKASAMIA